MLLGCWTAGWSEYSRVSLLNKCPHPAKFSTLEVATGLKISVTESGVSASADSAQRQPCLEL